jgi:uncharacterized membrane protein
VLKGLKTIFRVYFLTGLLVLGPLLISILIVKAVVEGTDNALQTARWLPVNVPGLGIIAAILIIFLAGFLGKNVFGKYIFSGAGELLERLPVIGSIYSSTKQVFETLLGDQNKNFGRVVLINYPSEVSWTLAFVTAESAPSQVQKVLKEDLLSVYVPTTPNPTSGFYMYVPRAKALPTDLTVDEAFKIIVSLGLAK